MGIGPHSSLHLNNKAIVLRTSPALCTPITPSRPILNDPVCSERVTMQCQWGEKPPKLPLSLGISSQAGGGPSHSHRQRAEKTGRPKDRACGSGDILADRQTDVLITVLRHRSRGQSNYGALSTYFLRTCKSLYAYRRSV